MQFEPNEDFIDIERHVSHIITQYEPNSREAVVREIAKFIVQMKEDWRFRAGEGLRPVGSFTDRFAASRALGHDYNTAASERYDNHKGRNGR